MTDGGQDEPARKVLVLYAHPRNDRSVTNVRLADAAREVDGVTLIDLYAEYPSFDIDVDREQDRLLTHDVLVFQHPLYWYSSPAILKEWQDLVLEYGFAYGHDTHALAGKLFFNAVTCGAGRDAYCVDGLHGHELRDLLLPFSRTFHLCRMQVLPPFALFGAGRPVADDRLDAHVDGYRRLLTGIVGGRLDVARTAGLLALSDHLDDLLPAEADA